MDRMLALAVVRDIGGLSWQRVISWMLVCRWCGQRALFGVFWKKSIFIGIGLRDCSNVQRAIPWAVATISRFQ